MELDDLKQQLHGLDRKLDAGLRLNRRALAEQVLDKADRATRRLGWALTAELALGAVALLLTGWFAAHHVREARFLVPGLVLHVFVIVQVATLVRQIIATRAIDYGAPLVAVQARIGALRVSRIRTTMGTLLLSPLLWTPLLVVVLRGFLGVDAYASLGAPYLVANVAVGLVVIAIGVVGSRRYADRFVGSALVGRLMRDLAGTNLAAATGFLDSLSRFEQEEPTA